MRSWRLAAAAGVLCAMLAPIHVAAYHVQWGSEDSPTHFRELAAEWLPHLRESDQVLTYTHWAVTPIYYYLPSRGVHYVSAEDVLAFRRSASPRVWRLSLVDTGVPDPQGLRDAVQGCTRTQMFVTARLRVELFEDCRTLQ